MAFHQNHCLDAQQRAVLAQPESPLKRGKRETVEGCCFLLVHLPAPAATLPLNNSAMATIILRGPVKGSRPWAASMLSTIRMSPFCHGKATVSCAQASRTSSSTEGSIGEPSP